MSGYMKASSWPVISPVPGSTAPVSQPPPSRHTHATPLATPPEYAPSQVTCCRNIRNLETEIVTFSWTPGISWSPLHLYDPGWAVETAPPQPAPDIIIVIIIIIIIIIITHSVTVVAPLTRLPRPSAQAQYCVNMQEKNRCSADNQS